MLHLALGAGAHGGHGPPDRCPFGVVVREGGEHVRVHDQAAAWQSVVKRGHQRERVSQGGCVSGSG